MSSAAYSRSSPSWLQFGDPFQSLSSFSPVHLNCNLNNYSSTSRPSPLSRNLSAMPSTNMLSPLISKGKVNERIKKHQRSPLTSLNTASLSTFELEYALLESALRRDNEPPASFQNLIGGEKASKYQSTAPLLEPESYFADILGDNGVPPQSLSHMMENDDIIPDDTIQLPLHSAAREKIIEDSDKIESELLGALANIVQSQHVCRSDKPCRASDTQDSNRIIRGLDIESGNIDRFDDLATSEPRENTSHYELGRGYPSFLDFIDKKKSEDELDETVLNSPSSDISMSSSAPNRNNSDLYENLDDGTREKVSNLREKISMMPRRKLRESLAERVTIEDVEPLMCLNRDELAGMLGLGVTTWKMFLHNTLGVPRWPARALKSQKVKEEKLLEKKNEAIKKGDHELAYRLDRDLGKLRQVHLRRRKQFRKINKIASLPGRGRI